MYLDKRKQLYFVCHLSRVSSATYHQNCRYSDSNYELPRFQMLKHTHTIRNIFHSKHHTNRSDLTPQFQLLDPTMVYKHRDFYVQWLRGTQEYTRRHIVTDDRLDLEQNRTIYFDREVSVQICKYIHIHNTYASSYRHMKLSIN